MVTHEREMAEYADRIILFVDGKIASDGRTRSAA
jgi:ABC-type lipoprotein export system ATPase subunit